MGVPISVPISVPIPIIDIISRCWGCITVQADYMFKLDKNLQALSTALDELKAKRDDVKRDVDRAEQQLRRPLSQVQVWLAGAEIVITEAEKMVEDAPEDIEKLCLGGCFSMNCRSSYMFGRQVASKLEEIARVRSTGDFNKVAEDEPLAPMDERPTELMVGSESTLNKIWNLLEEEQGGMIGLHGLGGVGKTTLLTQIYNLCCSRRPGHYHAVIWIEVSKGHTIENVQLKIWEKIRLSNDESWKKKQSDVKAQAIHRFLRMKKFVLLLDDIWERIDLIKVGVPLLSLQKSGSKVVFTTRLSQICGEMEAKEKIEVRCLRENDAWVLFQQKVGEETLNSHPDIRELSKKVAAECRGLPLALIVIGRAMTGKKSRESWEYAVEVLRNSAHELERTEDELYPVLKFSYDNLPDDSMRSRFLYCCLFPEDYRIPKSILIDYWFCEGLLDMFESIIKARMQGHNIIDSLLNAGLLEQDEDKDHVKMHDVIRDMALWIACKSEQAEKRFFVKAGLQLTEAPKIGRWEGVGRMSLMQNRVQRLTSTPTCPNLQTLFLNNNHLRDIADGFFQFMPNLRVLNLSECEFLRRLPKKICELVSLECLDLSKTRIKELSIELKSLTELKHLDLSKMLDPIRIPSQLISSFSKLQVFRLNSFLIDEEDVLVGVDEDLVEELGNLQDLSAMCIELKGAFALQRFVSFHNLQRSIEELQVWNFSNSVVFNVLLLSNMKCLDVLRLHDCEWVEEMKIERESGEGRMIQTSLFPTNTPCFHSLSRVFLERCGKLRDMTWLVLVPNLRVLEIKSCAKMEEIISEEKLGEVANAIGNPSPDPFPKLESLSLYALPQLKSICREALPFQYLKEMNVMYCSRLKKLPLNFNRAKGNNLRITGQQQWWQELDWEDEACRYAFLPFFMRM